MWTTKLCNNYPPIHEHNNLRFNPQLTSHRCNNSSDEHKAKSLNDWKISSESIYHAESHGSNVYADVVNQTTYCGLRLEAVGGKIIIQQNGRSNWYWNGKYFVGKKFLLHPVPAPLCDSFESTERKKMKCCNPFFFPFFTHITNDTFILAFLKHFVRFLLCEW